jgi:hypothetical protein
MQSVKNVVYVAGEHSEFIQMVSLALSENNEIMKVERQKVALENSTENRAVKMMKILKDYLGQRNNL